MEKVKIVAAILIVLLFLVIHIVAPEFLPEIIELLSHGDILETAEYIRSYGSMAIVFAFLLTLFVNALGFPPAIIFSTANTLIFGIIPGIILSCIAETIGVTISFLLLRFFFRDTAEKIISKSKFLSSIDHYSSEKGFVVMLIARMVPYVPSALLNAVGALSSLSLRDYFIASLIGKFPSTGIEAIIGHDTILQEEDPTRIIVVVIFAIILIAWAWHYEKSVKSRSN
ncbi:MAG: TVP38/TMEM64 family protein [Selenomonadaceae bacterium]|nr:TVP38/TMEM64 family protein [Selenomonadaceae bacterium]